MKWMLAVDGGGSKTTACASDTSGNIFGFCEKGPANYHIIGADGFKALMVSLIDQFCFEKGLERNQLKIISLGLAGVDRPADRGTVLALLGSLGLGCELIVNNDAAIALTGGLGEARGIVLIAGTGSIAYGINDAGQVIRAGGWGHLVSDEGSGYIIGREGLRRALKAMEDRDKPTVLLAKIMEYLSVDSVDELIGFIYQPQTGKAAIAALAKVVAEAAAKGDAVAGEILSEAAADLAVLVESVINRGFADARKVKVCTFGGVINNVYGLRQLVANKLAGKASVVLSARPPVIGALQLAYDSLNPSEPKLLG